MAYNIWNHKQEHTLDLLNPVIESMGYDHHIPKTGIQEYYALFQAYHSARTETAS